VRNRAKEIVELLADVEKIRRERKEAKANRNKYVGTGNDGLSFGGSGGRYGGFGNDSGGSYGGDYGSQASGYDRGAFAIYSWPDPRLTLTADYTSGGSSSGFRDSTPRRSDFEEYDAGEYETTPRRGTSSSANASTNPTTSTRTSTAKAKAASKAPEPAPEPVVNLLDFDDDTPGANASVAVNKALPALAPLAGSDNSTPQF
jgi:epsin